MAALLMPLLTRVAPLLLSAIAAFIAGCVLTHKVDDGALANLKAQYAQAQAVASAAALKKQQAFDSDAARSAQQDQQQQLALATDMQRYRQEIVRYAPKTTSCVPVGLVSVLRSAIGVPVNGAVPDAAGESDDACSSVRWPELARGVIDAFGRARANSSQLDALEGFITQAKKDIGR